MNIEQMKPTAWLVHAQYPFVTMDPPIEGGLPRTELFTREQVATDFRDRWIDEMRSAIAAFDLVWGKPQSEIRLHPDDYQELCRMQSGVMPTFEGSAGTLDLFSGVRVVEDEKAPRLPRITRDKR